MWFGRQPAFWIGLIATILIGIVQQVAGAGLISADAATTAQNIITTLAPLIAALLIRFLVTPIKAPVLAAGTEVKVQGSSDSVIIAPSPPGPTGVDRPAKA